MKKLDAFEKEILDAYEKGELKSTSPFKSKIGKIQSRRYSYFSQGKAGQHSPVHARLDGYSSPGTRRGYAIPDVDRQRTSQVCVRAVC